MRLAKRLVKPYSKALQKSYRHFRSALDAQAPRWARGPIAKTFDYIDLVFVDHGIFRGIYANRHEISPGVWRSSQPGPQQIKRLARQGIRTIINLRGKRNCGSYRLQAEACRTYGITLIDFPLIKSRAVPSRQALLHANELLNTVDYPVLIHCKSGADRAGLMSVLVHMNEGRPLKKAMRQLNWRFGHIKQSDTGILDHFFEHYGAYYKRHQTPFFEWLETAFDPRAVRKDFRAKGWANFLVNRAMQRE